MTASTMYHGADAALITDPSNQYKYLLYLQVTSLTLCVTVSVGICRVFFLGLCTVSLVLVKQRHSEVNAGAKGLHIAEHTSVVALSGEVGAALF